MSPPEGLAAPRRLFIGLMAPEPVRGQLARHRGEWAWPASARLAPPENFHLTLAFLGQVGAEVESALRQGLGGVAFSVFDLLLDAPGRFHCADIAFIAPRPNEALDRLRLAVHEVAQRCFGLAPQPNWQPHVTLARKGAAAVAPPEGPAIPWRVDAFSLVLSSAGRYEPVGNWRARQGR